MDQVNLSVVIIGSTAGDNVADAPPAATAGALGNFSTPLQSRPLSLPVQVPGDSRPNGRPESTTSGDKAVDIQPLSVVFGKTMRQGGPGPVPREDEPGR